MRNAILRHAISHYGGVLVRTIPVWTGSGSEIIVTPPTWRVRISRWLVGLAFCMLVFQAYSWCLVPWIEPPPPPGGGGGTYPDPPRLDSDPELAKLFPPGAWELSKPMELRTQWGRLLFQEYTRIDKGVELHPCTILFNSPTSTRDGKRGKRTIVLKTPEKAVISFSGDMDLVRAQIGELKGARLQGEVQIYSRETKPGANDALHVATRNIQILPTKIWTPYDVAFQYGSSRGSGRVLTITIASKEEGDARDKKQALVPNVEVLELVHLDRLHVDFPGKGLLGNPFAQADQGVRSANASADAPPPAAAVDVTCQGPFQFDFQKGVATLQDHVDVVRVNSGGDSDQLRCDRLLIYFQAAPAAGAPASAGDASLVSAVASDPAVVGAAPPDSQGAVPKMTVSRIEATGAEVILQAPSVQAAARGQLLQYDFQTRRVLLQDPQKALFAYREHVAEAPRLEYELHEDPKRLGKLWATGPGVYRGAFGEDAQKPLTAAWAGTLELQPQDDLHVLSVVQGASLTWGETGSFSADKLFIWLAEVETQVVEPAVTVVSTPVALPGGLPGGPELAGPLLEPSTDSIAARPKKTSYEVLPVKMMAQGNVHADSEQLKGLDTTQLEVWFDHPAPEPSVPDTVQPAAGTSQPVVAPLVSPVVTPVVDTDPAGDAAPSPPEMKQLELSGTQIRLRLWMVKPRPKVREATVQGQVRLAQLAPVPTDPALLVVTGDMLQLRTDHLERSAVDVGGTAAHPARVLAQGMLLEGSNLHVSQRENLMWSKGPGRTRLPARANRDRPEAADQHTLSASAPIWINWQGGMDFDGQLIRFMKQVEVAGIYTSKAGEQLHIRSIGDQLHATLNRYVEFAKTQETDDLDVTELRFMGDVFTENQTFGPNNVVTSQDRMKARDLTLDRRTGAFNALGPGWLTTTRIDKGDLGNRMGATQTRTAPPVNGAQDSNKLIYLRVDYQNAIQGNLDLRECDFVHFVRTVYGPVLSWDQKLDPTRQGGLGPDGIVMTCNQLRVVEMGDGKQRAIEMSALGNTVVEGSQFLANADRLTYVEAKSQLVFEGRGRNLATLRRRVRAGAEPAEFQAEKIIYGVKSGQVEVIGARKGVFSQAAPDIPNARIR